MKISYKGDYALKAVLELALNYDQSLITSHDLAGKIDAPVKFLEQVLSDLKKGGFIKSRRGSAGGYVLSKPPEQITVGDVVRHIDGPIEPIACVRSGYDGCAHIYQCVFREIWQRVYQAESDIIDYVTFEELACRVSAERQVPTYCI